MDLWCKLLSFRQIFVQTQHVLNRSTILICLSLAAAPLCSALDTDAAKQELASIETFQNGLQAMEDKLPQLATMRFRETLENTELSEDAQLATKLKLAESLIRTGIGYEASQILADKAYDDVAAAQYWRAEAIASMGHFAKAAEAFGEIGSKHPNYGQAKLAQASLLRSIPRTGEAIATLREILELDNKGTLHNQASLLLAEIFIDLEDYEEANLALEEIEDSSPSASKLREFLEAKIALAQTDFALAEQQFKRLISSKEYLSRAIFQACFMGKSDAEAGAGKIEDSISTLIKFIDENPNSPLIDSAFRRLGARFPDNAPADHPLRQKLLTWSASSQLNNYSYWNANIQSSPWSSVAETSLRAPKKQKNEDLASYALFYRAYLLSSSKSAAERAMASALFSKLRLLYPNHPLSRWSMLESAWIEIRNDDFDAARFDLSIVNDIAITPKLKDQANFLHGLILDQDEHFAEALAAFSAASQSGFDNVSEAAEINAGISALKAGQLAAFEDELGKAQSSSAITSLQLERALWLCAAHQLEGRSQLLTFINEHPEHARTNEARLALTSAALYIAPYDVALAEDLISVLLGSLTDADSHAQLTRLEIRANELKEDWLASAESASRYLQRFPTASNTAEFQLKLGESLFHNGDFNKARQVLAEIPRKSPNSEFTPFALYYAALAARREATPQALEESVAVFQQLIDMDSKLTNEARLQQARVQVDLGYLALAEASLREVYQQEAISPSLRRGAGLLLADTLHRLGSSEAKFYQEALDVYKQMLEEDGLTLSWKHRIHYQLGQTYQQMKKTQLALDSYYSVINQEDAPKAAAENEKEWYWFYKCAFTALTLLEQKALKDESQWLAVVSLARKIASFDGPRSEDAAKRASYIAQERMIWED